jgi:hypothetical protein
MGSWSIMSAKHVQCDRCGKEAILIFTKGLTPSDRHVVSTRTVQTIECPGCGKREQIAAFVKT